MILLFLPLLITGAMGEQIIENWECGSRKVLTSEALARAAISHCHYAVIDAANLCCKAHDLCYEVHSMRVDFTKQFCDDRFHVCLHDVSAKSEIFDCQAPLELFHALVENFAGESYRSGTPVDRTDQFAGFVDKHPLELDMQSLLGACQYSKMLVVHCHNSAVECESKDHARIRRLGEEESIVTHSYEDCRASMRECLQKIIEYAPTKTCIAKAKSIQKELNVYVKLDEVKHGKAIIDAYPFQAARLIQQCNQSEIALTSCYLAFDGCAQKNRREHPKFYSAVWQIKIGCHHELEACIVGATSGEIGGEDCEEAFRLAIARIREVDVPPQKSIGGAALDEVKDLGGRLATKTMETFDEGVEVFTNGAKAAGRFAGKVTTKVVDVVSEAGTAFKDWGFDAMDTVKNKWNSFTWG